MSQFTFVSKKPIEKGWSSDKKYCVTDADGTKYLLRIMPKEKSAKCADIFRMQKEIDALSVSICRPIEMGECAEGMYILQTWIDGEDASDAVTRLGEAEQYSLGLEAGKALRLIHSIPAPEEQQDWESCFNAKADRNIAMYEACPISFDGADEISRYVNENRNLLAGRPQTFQHGDYHIGNMMVENSALVVIDFDRYEFGDPWEDFKRIVWSVQTSPAFASGTVDGYFDGEVPLDFWRLIALYIGSKVLASVPWAIPFGDNEIDIMLRQAKEVLSWYDGMRQVVPTWYRGAK